MCSLSGIVRKIKVATNYHKCDVSIHSIDINPYHRNSILVTDSSAIWSLLRKDRDKSPQVSETQPDLPAQDSGSRTRRSVGRVLWFSQAYVVPRDRASRATNVVRIQRGFVESQVHSWSLAINDEM